MNTTIRGNTHLAGQKDMLLRLGHRSVRCGNDQDSAIHLGGAGDHIFHIVSADSGQSTCA